MKAELSKEVLNKVKQIEIHTNRLVNDSLVGDYHSVFKGRGMNFDEVREYVAGDDIRTIDWNVTARTGVPHIKKFTEERELTMMLMIDISSSGNFGSGATSKRELMAELGSVLAFSAVKNNDKVGLVLFTDFVELYIPPKKGKSHILRVIREILFFQPQGIKTDLEVPLQFLNTVCKKRAVTFLISDFLTGENQLQALSTKLRVTARRHDLIGTIVHDPYDRELPDLGWITFEDAETGEQIELDTSKSAIREEYKELAANRLKEIHSILKTSNIDILDLLTNKPYLQPLVNFFRLRKRRFGR